MTNPNTGGRYYLIDGKHVPAAEVELPDDPYGLLPIVGSWPPEHAPPAPRSDTDTEE